MPRPGTPQKKERFLAAVERGCTVKTASEYAQVDRTLPYRWYSADQEFANRWDSARDQRLPRLRDTAFDIAMSGSETMIKYLLNRYDPPSPEESHAPAVQEVEIVMRGNDDDPAADFLSLS